MSVKGTVLAFIGRHTKNGRGAFIMSYLHNRGKFPNLKHPKDLSEIWIKRVLDGEINKIAWLADKYAVREYVEKKGFANILTPLLAVFTTEEQIDFDALPERFALKANFGAGMNIICSNKNKLDYDSARTTISGWLQARHYSESEQHYNLIQKRIICEGFIDDGSGGFPIDYKFMCINGRVFCILVCSGRENGHAQYLPYSVNWEPLYHYYRGDAMSLEKLPCPTNLSEMIQVAERLAEDIDLVRVDLYSNGTRIWFGEMTLTPAGCIFHRWTQLALDEMGKKYYNDK